MYFPPNFSSWRVGIRILIDLLWRRIFPRFLQRRTVTNRLVFVQPLDLYIAWKDKLNTHMTILPCMDYKMHASSLSGFHKWESCGECAGNQIHCHQLGDYYYSWGWSTSCRILFNNKEIKVLGVWCLFLASYPEDDGVARAGVGIHGCSNNWIDWHKVAQYSSNWSQSRSWDPGTFGSWMGWYYHLSRVFQKVCRKGNPSWPGKHATSFVRTISRSGTLSVV